MKTQDYVKKFKLNINDKFNHTEFVADLANDFVALLELNKAQDNIKGFNNALNALRMKWDAINNKTVGNLPEKLWNYFFATVVVKLREELCPKDMEKKRQLAEEKRKAWEARKAQEKWEEDQFKNWYWSGFNSFLASLVPNVTVPLASFESLGLNHQDATVEDVNKIYRKLVMKHHPDKGGKQEDFVSITEAKNKCLQWLER